MESLSETDWDVILSGTGLPQSLLALALSRSGKKVLHIDKNNYYGGAEAALSLQEVETWAELAKEGSRPSQFKNAIITIPKQEACDQREGTNQSNLGFSRAYSLSLSPHLIYTRSNLLPALVSSKVYRQLEFLAVGSWWLYSIDDQEKTHETTDEGQAALSLKGSLHKIPGSREDVFADSSIDRRSSMSLMKFLKLAADSESHASVVEEWGQKPFPEFLESHLKISPPLQAPLLALTLSLRTPAETLTSYALPRIHRHLTSIGLFGPGFGAVVPKWGGLAEIAQVACRACAVGGGVYVLNKGFQSDQELDFQSSNEAGTSSEKGTQLSTVRLEGDEGVKPGWIAGSLLDMPPQVQASQSDDAPLQYVARSITIVSGSLPKLFSPLVEGAPPPAGAVIIFPTGSSPAESRDQASSTSKSQSPPVHFIVHSSDTGECPVGQCVIYGQTLSLPHVSADDLLRKCVERLLASVDESPAPRILWHMQYDQDFRQTPTVDDIEANNECNELSNPHILRLPDLAPGFVLEDDVLKHVRAAYEKIVGDEGAPFIVFEDREGQGGDDEGGD